MKQLTFSLIFSVLYVCAYSQSGVHNTQESQVGSYVLPDPLVMPTGEKISSPQQWKKRRQEWIDQYSEYMYGYTPEKKVKLRFEVVDIKQNALNNRAIRKRVNIQFVEYPKLPPIELVLHVPKSARKQVPVFVSLNYTGNHGISLEKDIPISTRWMRASLDTTHTAIVNNKANEKARGMHVRRWPLDSIIARGYAVATAYYGDIEPDYKDGWMSGIRSVLGDTAKSNNWGSIGAWAWGMSRLVDYLETDPLIDRSKLIALGHSRLGKAALWAGAQDERFAVVISNCSGEGGAALTRRNFGETMADIKKGNPFWYCKNYMSFLDRVNDLPFDQHVLLSLMAPRYVYVASASDDLFADPKGEFLSAVHADPVYKLFGKNGLGTTVWPALNQPIGQTIGYHMRAGIHDILLYDWQRFMDFTDRAFAYSKVRKAGSSK